MYRSGILASLAITTPPSHLKACPRIHFFHWNVVRFLYVWIVNSTKNFDVHCKIRTFKHVSSCAVLMSPSAEVSARRVHKQTITLRQKRISHFRSLTRRLLSPKVISARSKHFFRPNPGMTQVCFDFIFSIATEQSEGIFSVSPAAASCIQRFPKFSFGNPCFLLFLWWNNLLISIIESIISIIKGLKSWGCNVHFRSLVPSFHASALMRILLWWKSWTPHSSRNHPRLIIAT